jgi:predicted RNA-binding Zn-ribbon protein involved in translation (DUF1610 family)
MESTSKAIEGGDLLCSKCLTIGVPIVAGEKILGTHCPRCGEAKFFKDGMKAVVKRDVDMLIEMVHRTDHEGEHNSSLEAGPANCRFKIYFEEGATGDGRRDAMKSALMDVSYALAEAKMIGLISDPVPTRKKAPNEEALP